MFQADYKELMADVKTEERLIQSILEVQKEKGRCFTAVRYLKVAAAVVCCLIALAGGTVAVDAATDGAIRKWFGLKDSVVGGGETVSVPLTGQQKEEGILWEVGVSTENGEQQIQVGCIEDTPMFVFTYPVGAGGNGVISTVLAVEKGMEECTMQVFAGLDYAIANLFEEGVVAYGTPEYEELLQTFEKNMEQMEDGTELGAACVSGVQQVIDKMKSGAYAGAESGNIDPVSKSFAE